MLNHHLSHKIIGLLVVAMLIGGACVVPVSADSIGNITIESSNPLIGAISSYTLRFSLPSEPQPGESIVVQFPAGFNLAGVGTGNVSCVGATAKTVTITIDAAQRQVIVQTQPQLARFEPVTLTIQNVGNPSMAGLFEISVSTQHDTGKGIVNVGMSPGGGTGQGGVTGLGVTVNQLNAGASAEYWITFSLSTEHLLFAPNDYIDVLFPTGATLPLTISAGSVFMRNAPVTSMNVSGTRLRLWVPDNLGPFVECNIRVLQTAGILHPGVPGSYVLQVATSKQPNYSSSNSYAVWGTSVSNASVSVNPAQQGMAAQYDVTFTASLSGALGAGVGKIMVEFPAGTTVPSSLPAAGVRINNVAAVSVAALSTTKVAVTVPAAVAAGSTVRVVFGAELGIRNPTIVGSHQLSVSTSGDAAPVVISYAVTSSQIGTPAVQVSTGAAGVAAAYTITFTTGPGGALAAGIDRINIEFPAGTTIPSTILSGSVMVGGTPSTLVTSAGMVVSVTAPAAVGAGAQVVLVITEGAGVRNPVTGGSYTLRISTSRETTAVVSTTYTVSALPTVRAAIDPAAPDGYHGYYRTRPAITLTAQSAVDPQPVISYHFDDNADSVYGGQPLIAPEGTHTLTYYAVDRLGNRSESGAMTVAVDSIAPVVALTQPTDGQVLSSPSLTVQGTVDVGSTVQVNGHNAPVDATGVFVYAMTVQGSPATIVIDATDPAGNTAHRSVTVTLDTTPPSLTLTQPLNFQKFQRFPIVVAGRTEAGASVTVQGTPADVRTDGTFEYAITSAPDGALTITVVARDAAGNQVTRTVAVTVQSTKLIQMQVGTLEALVNGQVVALQTAPLIRNSTTLVPLRFVAETFGITPVWDGVFQIIDLPVGTTTVRLQIGQRFASVGGKKVTLDTAPVILNGVTMVPLRFIADTLGAETRWEAATKTIIIIYPRAS